MKTNSKKINKADAALLLEECGLKKTPFRLALLDHFIAQAKPLTGLQVFEGLQSGRKKTLDFDRATVFRNLKILVNQKVLQSTEFGTGSSHYYLKSSRHHHHVYCVECETVEPINYCGVAPMIEQAKQIGFSVLSHRLDLIGLCPACK